MILLNIKLILADTHPKSISLIKTPFLGGVLHGTFEHLVRTHAPAIASQLGMTTQQQRVYAVLPPPYGWQAHSQDHQIEINCGIMLFNHAQQYIQPLTEILQLWQEIRFAGCINKTRNIQITCYTPGSEKPISQQAINNQPVENLKPRYDQTFDETNSVTLNLLTPLTLISHSHRTKNKADTPPGLLRIIRSLVNRVQTLEPELAHTLQLGSQDWIKAEEHIRHAPIGNTQLEMVKWQYGSRTKPQPFYRYGLIGQLHYPHTIPASIHTLLHWGSWLGIGQGTTMGQGMYHIEE